MYVQKLRFVRDVVTDDPVVYIFTMKNDCSFVYKRELLNLGNSEFLFWLNMIQEKNETAAQFFQNWYADYYINMTEEQKDDYYTEFDQVELQFG